MLINFFCQTKNKTKIIPLLLFRLKKKNLECAKNFCPNFINSEEIEKNKQEIGKFLDRFIKYYIIFWAYFPISHAWIFIYTIFDHSFVYYVQFWLLNFFYRNWDLWIGKLQVWVWDLPAPFLSLRFIDNNNILSIIGFDSSLSIFRVRGTYLLLIKKR